MLLAVDESALRIKYLYYLFVCHRTIPNEEDTSPFIRSGVMSRMITTVPPNNPYRDFPRPKQELKLEPRILDETLRTWSIKPAFKLPNKQVLPERYTMDSVENPFVQQAALDRMHATRAQRDREQAEAAVTASESRAGTAKSRSGTEVMVRVSRRSSSARSPMKPEGLVSAVSPMSSEQKTAIAT